MNGIPINNNLLKIKSKGPSPKFQVSDNNGISDDLFDKFYASKVQIEAACGFVLKWNRLDNKKASLACTYISGLDFDNTENYLELMNKAIDLVLTLRKAFVPFLK